MASARPSWSRFCRVDAPTALLRRPAPRAPFERDARTDRKDRAMNRSTSLILFVVLVLGVGLALGWLAAPGGWYAGLAKPAFNPPAWLFGPVWTVLYVLVGFAGWLVWQRDRGGWPMKLWWGQMALNFLWTPVFFGAHQIGLALLVILLLLIVILAFIATAWREDGVAAWLFVPYAAWVTFASVLNGWLWAWN
jgi:tryptophan-rich sensory protein